MEHYNLTELRIVYIETVFRQKDKKLLSEFRLDKPLYTTKSEIVNTEKELNIPVSINEDSIGKPLSVFTSKGLITYININFKGKSFNFLDVIRESAKLIKKGHKDQIMNFDDGYKFYLLKDRTDFVLAVKILDTNTIDKIRYSLNGTLLSSVSDRAVDDVIIRNSGETQLVIRDGNIVSLTQNIKLISLQKPLTKALFTEYDNIGVIDIETFKADDETYKVYAIGFMTNLSSKPVIYYIDKDTLNSSKLILDFVNELMRPKYDKVKFYCHNLGGFDIVFILKVLLTYNDNNEDNKYNVSCVLRDEKILKVKITKDKLSLTISDSYAIMPNKLSNLGKDFEVATLKSKFPYKFAIQDHLFYEGNLPSIEYYDNISYDEYDSMSVAIWSFKDETIRYLINDLLSLHQILIKANKQVFLDYNLDMTDNITISGLALRLFFKDYYKKNIPSINRPSLYKDIKQAYYGGITEVYKPRGENLYYYDVNSLYPSVALNDMPGLICSKLVFYEDYYNIDTLFGFFCCEIETPLDDYLGLLPFKTINGLQFPLGKWVGWYFSEELKFAKEHGYKIKVLKGYSFNKESNVFNEYIDKVYKIKSNPINNTQKVMAKSLLNNLLGRFGINMDKPVSEIMSSKTFDNKMLMNKITSYKQISEDKYLVSYVPKLDYNVVKSHDLDITKLARKYKDKETQPITATSVVISAAVTAYARIHINKLKLDIINLGGKIYYSDTDSIVTNIQLSGSLVSPNKLGLLKLEYVSSEAIFISNKTYWMYDVTNGKIHTKAKGVKSSSLSYGDFLTLYNNINVKAVKVQSRTNWSLGFVEIKDTKITINSNSYIKRDKIFDKDGKWINTKPIIINEIDKALVLYQHKCLDLVIYKNVHQLKFKVINKSNLDFKTVLIYILSIFIIPISLTAFVMGSEEDGFIIGDSFSSLLGDVIAKLRAYREIEVSIDNKPTTDGNPDGASGISIKGENDVNTKLIKEVKNKTEVNVNEDSFNPYEEEIYVVPPKKSLYQGFEEEISRIRNIDEKSVNNLDSDLDGKGVKDAATQTTVTSPTTTEFSESTVSKLSSPTTTESTESKLSSISSVSSPDFIKDQFSPNTLKQLDEEIRTNTKALQDLDKVCKDVDTISANKERLFEERNYLLHQKSNHLNSVLEEARRLPINDRDMDSIHKEISELKEKVDNLFDKSEVIHETNRDNSEVIHETNNRDNSLTIHSDRSDENNSNSK